jgi:hypothetical protein
MEPKRWSKRRTNLKPPKSLTSRFSRSYQREGASPEEIEKAVAALRQLRQCFEGLTEEQLQILDEAKLNL